MVGQIQARTRKVTTFKRPQVHNISCSMLLNLFFYVKLSLSVTCTLKLLILP